MQPQLWHRHQTFNSGNTLGQKTYLLVKKPHRLPAHSSAPGYTQSVENSETSKRNQVKESGRQGARQKSLRFKSGSF